MINFAEWFTEVLMEKIPVSAQRQAEEDLYHLVKKVLSNYKNTENTNIKTIVSPQRVCFVVDSMPTLVQKKDEEVKGPETKISEEILDLFLQKHNISSDLLYRKQLGEKEFWYFSREFEEEEAAKALPKLLQEILDNMTWSEYMNWGVELRWIRPVRRIVSIFDKEPLVFYWQKANLTSMPDSLYDLNSDEEFSFQSFADYLKNLKDRGFYIDYYDRKDYICNQINSMLPKNEAIKKQSKKVIEEIARSTESPCIYKVEVNREFGLPEEIVVNVIVHHEKCVPVFEENRLSHNFFKQTNYKLEDNGLNFVSTSLKCIEARLIDAEIFWKEDLIFPIEHYIEELKNSPIHVDLSSYWHQSVRLEFMAQKFFSQYPDLQTAASFVNIDIPMKTVNEIPELHGTVSAIYAKEKYDLSDSVVNLIKNCFSEEGESEESLLLEFLQNLDLIVGFFGVGHIPRGSSDPLGLRQAAFKLLKTGYKVAKIDLASMIEHLIYLYKEQGINLKNETFALVEDFLKERLAYVLRESSDKFGKLFVRDKITWKEKDNLQDFIDQQHLYERLRSFHVRLSGIVKPISESGDKKPSIEYYNLVAVLDKKAKTGIAFLDELSEASLAFLDSSTKIKELNEDSKKEVLELLQKVKREFDEYMDFS